MKTLRFFLGLITLLFVLCLATGCRTPSLSFGWDPTNGWEVGPWQQYPEGRPPKVEEAPVGVEEEEDAERVLLLPRSGKSRSGPSTLTAETPAPIGPPGPGRFREVYLTWDHSPSADGTTEYRVYYSRQADTNKWDGFSTVSAELFHTTGRRFTFQYRSGGTIRFVATARRPPDETYGETEWVESDQSNMITVKTRGFPDNPVNLAPTP